MTDRALVEEVRRTLRASGDPDRAAQQQRYMKSAMPFHGVTHTAAKPLLRPVYAAFRPADRAEWEGTVRALWDEATHREERYAALAVARHRTAREWQDVDTLPLYRHLVSSGAWWDFTDEIAAHLVGAALARDRGRVTPVLRHWATDDDPWIRRAAVLAQLRHRADTDTGLLTHAIEANAGDASFWLRKAIGWALREHSRTDPDWVRSFVASHDLAPLSRREAQKHL